MSELLGKVLKGFKEYFEWRNAPEEAASLLLALSGDANERVLYKGLAQYVNARND
jgi:ABC-type nitrate/sulfonate/bicarbonate transport system substrate-binding protein